MRRARGPLLGIALLLLQPQGASAQVPELLQPVEKGDIASLESKSNYDLRATLYFAKRYRFVHIDFGLLERSGAEFTITPFPDLSMQVVALGTAGPGSDGFMRVWDGELTSPKFPNDIGIELPEHFIRPPVYLFVRKGEHQVPVRVAKKIAALQAKQSGDFGPIPNLEGAPEHNLAFTKLNLETVSGQWFVPARGARIVLQPIDDDPRFHVVYEENPEKVQEGGHSVSEADRLKMQRRADFLKALEIEKSKAGQ